MTVLSGFHQRLGLSLLVVLAVAALAAPLTSPAGRRAVWRVYLRCCEVAVGLQALIGLLLVAGGRPPRNGLHWVYGAAVLLALPLATRLAAAGPPERERLVLGAGALAAALLALRAVLTGG